MKYEAKLTFKGKLLLFVLSNPFICGLIWKSLRPKLEEWLKEALNPEK